MAQGLTDTQSLRLVREILEQVRKGRLDKRDAMTVIVRVLDPGPLTYEQLAIEVRSRGAHLGDR
jgi:hypothetical protein